MAERVTMWKSKNGKVFETGGEAEEEDRAEEILEALYSLSDDAENWPLEAIARKLAEQGYRITNVNPAPA